MVEYVLWHLPQKAHVDTLLTDFPMDKKNDADPSPMIQLF